MLELKKYKDNFLVFTGSVLLIIASFAYFLFLNYFENQISEISKFQEVINFKTFILSALILAPLAEELIFRGFFSRFKYLKYFYFVGALIYILVTANYYLFIIYILILVLKYLNGSKVLVYILNSLLFALVHYNYDDLSFNIIVPIFFQLGLAFILIWVVINFEIFYSFLVHFFYNLIVIIALVFSLQYPKNQDKISYDNQEYSIEWYEIPFFNQEDKNVTINNKSIELKNIESSKLFNLFLLDKDKFIFNKTNTFQNVSLKIIKKNSLNEKEIDKDEIIDLLLKAELLKQKN